MKVSSYMRMGNELAPVEVELSLAPGLPQVHFMGLPDAALKESALRIRTALREQGFQFPQAHQVLVHLKPTHLKKSSRGLDLAIAAALLWETGQLPLPSEGEIPVLYGEVTLKGQFVRPEDTDELVNEDDRPLMTGPGPALERALLEVSELKDLAQPNLVPATAQARAWQRPRADARSFPESAAEVAAVVAAGEHSVLLAGPPGSGKSTLASSIAAWIEAPDENPDVEVARRLWRRAGLQLTWRPVLRPHHSVTPKAMIGGGAQLWPGEITRAHGGVLVMDELLEFHAQIQEALREPVESGQISLVRGASSRTYPARLLLIATTNLCACGRFVPRRSSMDCRCAKAVRRRTLTRLTGPFVDRFALFALTDEWEGGALVTTETIATRVEKAVRFRKNSRKQTVPNSRLLPEAIEDSLTDFQREHLLGEGGRSRRRRSAVLKVARTLADLRESEAIGDEDLNGAIRLSVRSHRLLEEWQE